MTIEMNDQDNRLDQDKGVDQNKQSNQKPADSNHNPGGHKGKKFDKNNPKNDKRRFDKKNTASDLFSTVVSVRRVTNVVKAGRILSFSVLVVCGNQKGMVGYGLGKAKEVIDAKNKAMHQAKKNMVRLHLFENRTIYHDQIVKFGATRVIIRKAKSGTGLIAGGVLRTLCSHAGIKDIVSKVLGSRTSHNVVRAGVQALASVNSFTSLSNRRGIKFTKSSLGHDKSNSLQEEASVDSAAL